MKKVKIIGLNINQKFGILQASHLEFDTDNNLIVVKGEVGAGKTSFQKALQLTTQGKKALQDSALYGNIDVETQLLDGDIPLFVGCRSNEKGGLTHTIYTKNASGKIEKNPVIDGIKATPSTYLNLLQTELTWKMDELTSENPTVQKKILLKLYQHKLSEQGVIFDKSKQAYQNSILHKIEQAENNRSTCDMIRKQYGGIADDLKEKGFDVNRPESLPKIVNISDIDNKILDLQKEIAVKENTKTSQLDKLKVQAENLTDKAINFNNDLKSEYDKKVSEIEEKRQEYQNDINQILLNLETAQNAYESLHSLGYRGNEVKEFIKNMPQKYDKFFEVIPEPEYIVIKNNKIQPTQKTIKYGIVSKVNNLRNMFKNISKEGIDTSELTAKIDILRKEKIKSENINKICKAVDTFFDWQAANELVVKLKGEYETMLTKVDTGVEGLKIMTENDNLFLMYNGHYDVEYFSNRKKEYRKLSSYSGTQKPVICLLIQSYLLNQKPKALRYMYIDNVPMDRKTTSLLNKMGKELDLTVFLNMTGDFEAQTLNDGEYLISGGEVFFNK